MTALPLYPQRPRTRGECADVPRPCPFVSCRHHLFLDVNRFGHLVLNYGDKEPDELERSCSLDVADAEGNITLGDVGAMLGVSRQAADQIERSALVVLREAHGAEPTVGKNPPVERVRAQPGARFGRWTLIGPAPGLRRGRWDAVCDCGTRKSVNASRLAAGEIHSCGCLKREVIAATRAKRTRRQTRPDSVLRAAMLHVIANADGIRLGDVAKTVKTDIDRARPLIAAMVEAGELETETLPTTGRPVLYRIAKAEAAE